MSGSMYMIKTSDQMNPHHIFVLKNLFQRFFGNHYPTEIIRLIVMILYKPIQVVTGYDHTAILINDRTYVWGRNGFGQLGLGDYDNKNYPVELSLKGIKIISCGGHHTIAVIESNKTYTWGYNHYGQLGLGDNIKRNSPFELSLLSDIKSISCGENHTIAMLKSNKIYVWGRNTFGQLGLGDTINKDIPQELKFMLNNIESISCGCNHTIVMTIYGEIYVWGKNDDGRLGLGDNNNRYLPTKLLLANIRSVICGGFHTIALTSDNKIYSWGHNLFGQLGLGDRFDRKTPCLVDLNNIKLVSCGLQHTITITQNGMTSDTKTSNKVYIWGSNIYGQLGLGDNENRIFPQELIFPNVKMISCSSHHTIAITNMNDIYVWGWVEVLGLGDGINRNTPYQLKFKF